MVNIPSTQDDDKALYYHVCDLIGTRNNINIAILSFNDVMFSTKFKFPSMESVRRCRQKIQAEDITLQGTRRNERMALQDDFVEFSRNE